MEKERELGRVLEEIRPLSDGAAYEHSQLLDPSVLGVKRRETLPISAKLQVLPSIFPFLISLMVTMRRGRGM